MKAFIIHEQKGEKQRFKYELSNLQRTPQDDSLFELPPGAQKFDAMAMMGMGGAGGMDMAEMQRQAEEAQRQQRASGAGAQPATQSQSQDDEDGGFAGEVAEEANQSAQDTIKDETGNVVEDSIRKGFGKLFGR